MGCGASDKNANGVMKPGEKKKGFFDRCGDIAK